MIYRGRVVHIRQHKEIMSHNRIPFSECDERRMGAVGSLGLQLKGVERGLKMTFGPSQPAP